jgi:nucleoid-associated protein YgaU
MGLFNFMKEAGEKLFGRGEAAAASASPEEQKRVNQAAAEAIFNHIKSLGLKWSNLMVHFTNGQVVITGSTPDQENREKIILAAGNVQGVDNVDDQLTVDAPTAESHFYTVAKGDTLWKIAASQYGDGAKYPVIFEANKPMLSDPDKIYPGQNLRIPAL